MSHTKKRNRACEECHRLKIKCDVITSPGNACERCSRNNLDCVPTPPRLQRDRINELEAQVQELTSLLRARQNPGTPPSLTPPASLPGDHDHANVLAFLDARIPLNKQQELLHLFAQQAGAAWPFIRLPIDLGHIRTKSPVLLLSVLVCTTTQGTQDIQLDVHDDLVRETMRILGEEVIGRGQRSLELVQALLVAGFWNKAIRGGQVGSCYQVIQLAADMAIDLGIAGLSLQPSPAAYFSRHDDPTSLEAHRTWLACFIALEMSSISIRRPNPIPWNDHHQECLWQLESKGDLSDMLLGQIVRIVHLIQETSEQLGLCQLATFVDGNHYSTHATIDDLKRKVDAWAAQVPPSLASSQTLNVWHHLAMINMYELVLHTPTNKSSFAAPFIPQRIPVNDFPKPSNIISPLKIALGELVRHCHEVMRIASEMDPALVLNLPSFCFAPTVVYSLYVLVTVLVASTDPKSTYSSYLTKDQFHIEECGLRMRSLTEHIKCLDPTMSCWTARLFDATGWLENWYNDYNAILQRYEASLGM
jgi:hypothetical protein